MSSISRYSSVGDILEWLKECKFDESIVSKFEVKKYFKEIETLSSWLLKVTKLLKLSWVSYYLFGPTHLFAPNLF